MFLLGFLDLALKVFGSRALSLSRVCLGLGQ